MEKIIVEDNLNANTELATNEMDRPSRARRHASRSTLSEVLRTCAARTHRHDCHTYVYTLRTGGHIRRMGPYVSSSRFCRVADTRS